MIKLHNYNELFFYSDYYKEWSGNICEIIGVQYSLKLLAILKTSSSTSLLNLEKICRDKNLLMATEYIKKNQRYVLGLPNDNEYCVYLSRDNKIIKWARKYLKNFSENFNQDLKLELGLKLGYPKCCIRNYMYNFRKINYFSSNKINTIPFYNNNLLTGGRSNAFLLTHTLCSYWCRNSIKYAKKLLSLLEKEEPNYFNFLYKNLKKPILFWINSSQFHYFLSTLISISLNGIFSKDSIDYRGFYISLPLRPEMKLINYPTNFDLYYLSMGNRLIFDRDILIYNNKKYLHKIKWNKNLIIIDPIVPSQLNKGVIETQITAD